MDSFIDTNVSIAYSFTIDPFNTKSNSIFNMYDKIHWSTNVKVEFDEVFNKKLTNLITYFKELKSHLLKKNHADTSLEELLKFLDENYPKEFEKKIKSSLYRFWDIYVDNMYPTKNEVLEAIDCCLFDLQSGYFKKKEELYFKIKLTPERKKKYKSIHNRLHNKYGVHNSDAIIVLDAHDYNLRLNSKIDFITLTMNFIMPCAWLKISVLIVF